VTAPAGSTEHGAAAATPSGGAADDGGATYGETVEKLKRRFGGNADAALAEVLRERRRLARQVARLKGGDESEDEDETPYAPSQLPKDAVVLTGPEAQAWSAYRALGKTPAELAAALTERETLTIKVGELEGKVSETDRRALHADAAKALGYDVDVLDDLAHDKRLVIEMREMEVEVPSAKPGGTPTVEMRKVPHLVTGEGKDAKAVPLAEAVDRGELKKYGPALRPSGDGTGQQENGNGVKRTATGQAFIPDMQASGRAAPLDKAGAYLARMNAANAERANPLKRAAPPPQMTR